jgi:DNA-binding beta-propeller fold protein YncE
MTVSGILLVVVLGFPIAYTNAQAAGRVRAPEFPKGIEWLNTGRPLTIASLRGQVVLLDFWTYCCINCMHIFPDLRHLESKYRNQPFVVIGVHSGKFSQEKDPENIRQAILRHNLEHPVVVDSDYAIWNAYAVNSWPTLVVIDPEGYVVGGVSGEGHRETIDRRVGKLLEEHKRKGTLGEPMRFRTERESFKGGELEFPGKVLADAERNRLFISDTNHHRVLVTDLEGRVQEVIGRGQIGLADGPFDQAQFHQPQGLALAADGKTLYVADTENHAIRTVDLDTKTVMRIAGTGKQSKSRNPNGPGRTTALSSPWDLARVDDRLYIATAGLHQIWLYDLKTKKVVDFAGTGAEAGIDGPRAKSAFAQPSGLATDGMRLYVADSEISSIRAIDLVGKGGVTTLAGSGGLFDFGRQDGPGRQARFQHPLGVALHGKKLFVADTFNHLIRQIDLNTGEVTIWLGTGKPEKGTPESIGFFEPGGISVGGDTLYVADTNNHRVLAVEIPTKKARTLEISIPQLLGSRPGGARGR